MHNTLITVRLTTHPDEEREVTVREALSLRAQGLLLGTAAKAPKAAPAPVKESAK